MKRQIAIVLRAVFAKLNPSSSALPRPASGAIAFEALEDRSLFSATLSVSDAGLQSYVQGHEGVRLYSYLDSKKIPTIGVGFNLKAPGAKASINSLGLTTSY